MKVFLFLCFLIIIACNTVKPLSGDTIISDDSSITDEMNRFLLSFEKTVKAQKQKALFNYIDSDYRTEQLGNLEGNLDQFIDELFCGRHIETDKFHCYKLDEIENIKMVELIQLTPSLFQARYEVQSKKGTIIVEWEIQHAEKNSINGFGFIGAYG